MGKVMEQEEEVRQWVHEHMPSAVSDLADICRIRSVADVSGHPDVEPYGQGCIDVLHRFLAMGEQLGFQTRNYDNYVGCISYGDTTEEYQQDAVGIWAHLDVVDEGDRSRWQYPPYEPTVRDGYMIARGCQDNKSSAIIALYTLKYLKEHGIALHHGLQLYAGTCEEQGMYDLDYYTAHYPVPALSLVPDAGFPVCCAERGVLNGELVSKRELSPDVIALKAGEDIYKVPDMAEAVLKLNGERRAFAGYCQNGVTCELREDGLHIFARGTTCNAARPAEGDNALSRLIGFLLDRHLCGKEDAEMLGMVQTINHRTDGSGIGAYAEDPISGPTVLCATQAQIREGHLVIGIASRYPFVVKEEKLLESIRNTVEPQGFALEVLYTRSPKYYDPSRKSVQILTDISNHVLGRKDKPYAMSGGTYARKLPNAFAFGAGMQVAPPPAGMLQEGHGDYHQADESVALERVEKGTVIYILSVLALDQLKDLREQ